MLISLIVIALAFGYLLYETKGLSIRLPQATNIKTNEPKIPAIKEGDLLLPDLTPEILTPESYKDNT